MRTRRVSLELCGGVQPEVDRIYGSENCGYRDKLLRFINFPKVIDFNLTKTQKSYIMLYYTENKTVSQIAQLYGVNKSTVSRTIKRAENNLRRAFGEAG